MEEDYRRMEDQEGTSLLAREQDIRGTGHDTTDAHGSQGQPRTSASDGGVATAWRGDSGGAVAEWAEEYRMDHPRRGRAVIFNNKQFHDCTKLATRKGTDIDASALHTLFNDLGFDVSRHDNVTADFMLSLLQAVAKEDAYHQSADCFACVILTHGDESGVLYGTDRELRLQEVMKPFKGLVSLAGKPKLFFVQACRGDTLHDGMEVCDAGSDDTDKRRIPAEADFLVAYSCVPGHYSWRHVDSGSWFVQALVSAFHQTSNGQTMDLLTLLTRVAKQVASMFQHCPQSGRFQHCPQSGQHDQVKTQVPCITSMLTRDVIFSPKP